MVWSLTRWFEQLTEELWLPLQCHLLFLFLFMLCWRLKPTLKNIIHWKFFFGCHSFPENSSYVDELPQSIFTLQTSTREYVAHSWATLVMCEYLGVSIAWHAPLVQQGCDSQDETA